MDKMHSALMPTRYESAIRSSEEYFGMYPLVVANLSHILIERATSEILRAYEGGKSIFLFGNGGSAALASHFACDLGKGTVIGKNGHKRFRVLALTDSIPLMTAWANDSCFDQIFAEQLRNFIASGDVVFAISGSGNSPNVLHGLEVARSHGARTIGLTGFDGGRMKLLCDVCIIVPSNNMQIIEDFHLSVTHAIFSVIRQRVSDALQAKQSTAAGGAD